MDNIFDEIKSLRAKKETAQTMLTRYTTQLESMIEERGKLEDKLKEQFGIRVSEAEAKIADLKQTRDKLLEEAKKVLDQIKL